MRESIYYFYLSCICLFTLTLRIDSGLALDNPYPDQHYVIEGADSLLTEAQSIYNIIKTDDNSAIQLAEDATQGYIIIKQQSSEYPFDVGLPSWNGTAPDNGGAFRVFIRVPHGSSSWSPWLEVGYWNINFWSGSKSISYSGGKINIDTVVLYSFKSKWQFKIEMKRTSTAISTPTLSMLSFFISDDRTTDNVNISEIVADKPEPIFIPTTFLAQREISSEYGGRICSPTTVSMILLSYDIDINPLNFAMDTYDPYYDLFGVWPRVVQNASEYGLSGTVTRYRTWSDVREVLANNGRIAMSIGQPLYSGHLVMLAGFTNNGSPIVHDPARPSDGYRHVFNKYDLSQAWFNKGGVAYTFYLKDSSVAEIKLADENENSALQNFILYPNYPNPFNSTTKINYQIPTASHVKIEVFNIRGRKITTLINDNMTSGKHSVNWNGRDSNNKQVVTGVYYYQIQAGDKIETKKMMYLR